MAERTARPQVRTNWIDRAVTAISPVWGMRRLMSRVQQAQTESALASMGYVGGRFDRKSLQEYHVAGGSADADYLPDQMTLRARSRDLVRNSPVAAGAAGTSVTHVVGTGLRLQSEVDQEYLGLTDEQAEAKQVEIERIWRTVKNQLDYEGETTWMGLLGITFRGMFESGDILAVRRRDQRPGQLLGLKVQLIESDRVSNPRSVMDSVKVAGGVEVDLRTGRPIAYHVADRHPGDFAGLLRADRWVKVPVMGGGGSTLSRLVFEKRRPAQRRGVPVLAPVIEPLKQITRLTEYELQASVVNSLFAYFIKTTKPSSGGLPVAPEGTPEAEKPTIDGDIFLNPGAGIDLLPEEDVVFANPNRPNDRFDGFFRALVQQIGMAIETPYEVLMHLYQNSYSASKAALLDAWRMFQCRRTLLAENFCELVLEWVLTEAVATGLIDLPGFLSDPLARAAWLKSSWIGDAPGQINPVDDAKAAIFRIAGGLSNHSIETAALGRDWDEVHRQHAREIQQRTDAGMPPIPSASGGASAAPTQGPDDDDQNRSEAA